MSKVIEQYQKTKDIKLKHQLITHYAALVKIVASRLNICLVQGLELNDLIGYGVIGLVDAIEKYDIHKHVKFETYASLRIRGEILDSLRKSDWAPREIRKNQKQFSEAEMQLQVELNRTPTDEEISAFLGLDLSTYLKKRQDVELLQVTSWEEAVLTLEKKETCSFEQEIERISSIEVLAQAIEQLTDREQKIIKLYYYEGLTFQEIGKVLDLSFSRVSQLHIKSISSLRETIQGKGEAYGY